MALMQGNLLWAVLAALMASLAAIIGSMAILALRSRAEQAAIWLLSFAIGTLLAGAVLHLIPEALELGSSERVMALLLSGIVVFIVLERAIRWRHSHVGFPETHHHGPDRVTAVVLLWGDALHNLIDGFILGVSFSVSPQLGLVSAVAVFAHEVPQEIGDFAVLLGTGMPKRRALLLNYLSATTVILGTLLAFLFVSSLQAAAAWLLPVAAGGFIYIALADLVPSLHHRLGRSAAVAQILLMLAGIGVIWAAGLLH